ncbi:MAG TPA: peptidoglycan bridge formation glycyltransferase FemA/FemB family protein [Candidatus Limnocylindrales bacterium]|nr:peptidoglycan bridge formation glycyltransferase FemA/FemB family protein [Candidatus Limnocylindrales bacterium]
MNTTYRPISSHDQEQFDAVVTHPLQSYEWGEFREKTGVKVIRRGLFDPTTPSGQDKLVSGFQLTIHKIPHTKFTIAYLPKGEMPTDEMLEELKKIGREERCVFIQLEPNVIRDKIKDLRLKDLVNAAHPLFTKYTFVLDLSLSEEEILKNMHQKARYNIRVAQKNGVEVSEDNSEKSFKEYLRLTRETTKRQKFYAHTEEYHKRMWEALRQAQGKPGESLDTNKLSAHLLAARYKGKVLTSWILFVFKDTLYYPYGASSSENRDVMASNLVMFEAIRFGQKLGLKKFDMWGAMGSDPDKKDPWYGFHSFKEKYNPKHVEFIGSFDLIINPVLYNFYKVADKMRWLMLRFKK